MNRRKFIAAGGFKLGILTFGSGMLLSNSCHLSDEKAFNASFSSQEVRLINELGDVIIPPTDIPGAKEARVGEFIALVVEDCYLEEDKIKFKEKLAVFDVMSNENYGRFFLDISEKEKVELVSKLDNDNESYQAIKGMIVSAYLTSEVGMTQLFDYYPVPGRYDGCTVDKPW